MSLKFMNKEALEKFGLKDVNSEKDLITFINDQIKNRVAKTASERLDVLEARDKVLKYKRFLKSEEELNEEDSQQGTCMDMCPEKERYHREHLNQYKSFEMRRNEMGNLILDHRLMIKEYSRSSADQDLPLPNELRSSDALLNTIKYILKEILSQAQFKPETDNNWINDWFDFIWNRTRSIRKDITQQRSNDQKSIQIHEICARFHIYCSHKFCDQPPEIFSYKINRDHLVNCLQSLIEFYDDPSTERSPNEAEFRAYIILSQLEDVGSILKKTQRLRPQIRNSPQVKIALKIFFAYNSRNYVKFFRLILSRQFNYIAACLVHHYVVRMRVEAVRSIAITYKRRYPFDKLGDILCFDNEEDVFCFLEKLNVEITNDETERFLNFPRSNFSDQPKSRRSFKLVESKFQQQLAEVNNQDLCDIIYGSRIRDSIINFNLNQQSFNENGFYCANDIDLVTERNLSGQRQLTSPQPTTSASSWFAPIVKPAPPPVPQQIKPPNVFGMLINNQVNNQPVPFARYTEPDELISVFESIFESDLKDCIRTVCTQTLLDERFKLNFILNLVVEDAVATSIKEMAQKEIKLIKIMTDIRDSILVEAISELIREQFVTDRNSLFKNRFLDSYSNQLFDEVFIDMFSNVLSDIVAELKYEYLESLYLNVYFTEIYPQHLNEILQDFIYEDTQFWLNVNLDLASDLQLSIDHALVKQVFSKWLLKSKEKKASNYRIEETKTCLFKFVRCESYLLHLSWLTVNYQYLIDRLNSTIGNNKNRLLHYKLMFIIPKLSSDSGDVESVKRWLLSKFFHFDRKTFTYSTQYSYYLLNSFLQQYGIKFCMKAYFIDSSATSEKIENEKMRRIYFGSTGAILILLPFSGGVNSKQFEAYLIEHRNRFRNIIKLVNENLDEEEIISKLKIFIISYLNDEQQTQLAIDFIMKPKRSMKDSMWKSSGNITHCVLDGRVVRDNQIVEESFASFLTHSYINTPDEVKSLSILSFFHIFDLTILKFFEHLNKKSHIMPFNTIIEEYNLRLDMLIREFLSKNEYKKLSWPIPEHTDFTKAWLAKFWNTEEVINDKLFEIQNILSLDSIPIVNDHDYKQAKRDTLNYLHKITKQKADNLNECESICQVESRIVEAINEFESNKSEIKWQKIISIIVEYLLTNGCVKFRSRRIHFDQFTIYCNVSELKSFDWINFGEERRIDNFEVSASNESTGLAQSIDNSNETISDKENVDYELSSVIYEDEPSHFQINRRNYFNMKTNKRLNSEFDSKIKNFINVVNNEKVETATLSDRLKKIVNFTDESKKVETLTECVQDEKSLNCKKLETLMNSLNEESNNFKTFNDKLKNSLNN